ncbi:hypothetical protein B0H34DRAFT_785256 [Crassisporium funariophilum]|nr:hypothetical protein B0H34DRAFT_785256 [Crassisporium funariophilum]
MATPSSSATSPSPPMPYLPHAPGHQQQAASSTSSDEVEREQRKKAVQKFLARAEISMVTRALRARLSYASYKATHNIPHVALRELEAQTQNQSQTASFNRTIAAKRKAAGATNYYNNPATQGSGSAGAGTLRRGGSGVMAPPTSSSSPRTHYPHINGTPGYSGYNEIASSSRNPGQAPTPPPTGLARTIHNPSDPPVPAPLRPAPSPRARVPKSSPRNQASRSQPKAKQTTKAPKVPPSPDRRKTKRASVDKGKQKQHANDMDVDGDVDMKAAATLTSLLMHHRPSIAGSASSPRSSIDGSEVGSVYSLSHFAQSSARTTSAAVPAPLSAAPSSSSITTEPVIRNQTPPRPAPSDNEAADLMLFLATSPSPARPANKDSKDMAAYRALGGGAGPLRSTGRVLFPSTSAADLPPDREEYTAGTSYRPPALTRGGDNSFTTSIFASGSDLGMGPRSGASDQPRSRGGSSTPTAPPPASASGPTQLLPPAPLPLLPSAPASPAGRKEGNASPKPGIVVAGGPSNPAMVEFNFHEFINASPSPSRVTPGGHGGGTVHKPNLGLRADVGRKLFEEEQMRHAHAHAIQVATAAAAAAGGPGKRQEERALGAGIDLVQS